MNQPTTFRRTKQVDMSPAAVDRRLRDLAQLYKLGMSIKRAKPIGPVVDPTTEKKTQPER